MFAGTLKQIVPAQACLDCEICCRYAQRTSAYVPYFFPEEAENIGCREAEFTALGRKADLKPPPIPHQDGYACQFFEAEKNSCRVYPRRPLDCRLYPFMVTYDKDFAAVVLALDTKCPYGKNRLSSKEMETYADYLAGVLESQQMVERINEHKNFINDFQEDTVVIRRLENLSKRVCPSGVGLRRLSLKDKGLFDEYFLKLPAPASAFAFGAIYIWSPLLNILWKKIDGALCVFAGSDKDYFLFIPPAADGAIEQSLRILKRLNAGNSPACRIENVPEGLCDELTQSGWEVRETSPEYIYSQKELAELKGDRFKAKRSLINHFLKNYPYRKRAFTENDIFACLELYRQWGGQKLKGKDDDYSAALAEDSYFAQKIALMNAGALSLQGLVVEINGAIKGYTLGFPLNKDVFVILFETAELKKKGLAQFIFREFAGSLAAYKYINVLSDCGLAGLRRAKESYRPLRKVRLFTAYPLA